MRLAIVYCLGVGIAGCADGGGLDSPVPDLGSADVSVPDGETLLDAPMGDEGGPMPGADMILSDMPQADLPQADMGTDMTSPDMSPPAEDMTPPDMNPPANCVTDVDCSDGMPCNGVETCTAGGTCAAGTPVVCNDSTACTDDSCNPATGACRFVPNDARCLSNQSCSPTSGCVDVCMESPCRLVSPQCGCAAGQSCRMDAAGARSCGAVGSGSTGSLCTSLGACRAGDHCVGLGGGIAACHHFCATDSDCTGAGALCLFPLEDNNGNAIPNVRVCSHACEPARQVGCPSGSFCVVGVDGSRNLTFCNGAAPGSGALGSACTSSGQCGAGMLCVSSQCAQLCRTPTGGASSDCPTSRGYNCVALNPGITIGSTAYGACIPQF